MRREHVISSQKNKITGLARLGEHALLKLVKKEGGRVSFFTQNFSPSLKNAITHGTGHPSLLVHHSFAFPIPFCIVDRPQQVTSSFLVSLAFN